MIEAIILLTHYWRIRTRLPERFGQHCRIIASGKRNSYLIEFEDGYRVVTSRWSVRKMPDEEAAKS